MNFEEFKSMVRKIEAEEGIPDNGKAVFRNGTSTEVLEYFKSQSGSDELVNIISKEIDDTLEMASRQEAML